MDDHWYWTKSTNEMLDLIGGDEAHQLRILSGDLPSVRAALKGTRFEVTGYHELATIIANATTTIRVRRCAASAR